LNGFDIENKIVTHNHPSNTPISLKDFKIFLEGKALEMRATTFQYTYSISNPNKVKLNYIDVENFWKSMYQKAKIQAQIKIDKGLILAKDLLIEIQDIQWELTSKEFKFVYDRK